MHRTRTSLLSAATAAGLAALALQPAAAPAATNPYSGPSVCGPGFVKAKSWPVRSNDRKVLLGELVLSYGPGKRARDLSRTCAVLLKRRSVGKAAFMSVRISQRKRKLKWRENEGRFSYYAGPVYVTGTPACVNVGGFIAVPRGREGLKVEMSRYTGHCVF